MNTTRFGKMILVFLFSLIWLILNPIKEDALKITALIKFKSFI